MTSDPMDKIRACATTADLDLMVDGRTRWADEGLAGWNHWTPEERQVIAVKRAELARAGR